MITVEQVQRVKPHWSEEDCRAWVDKYSWSIEESIDKLLYDRLEPYSDFSYIHKITETKYVTSVRCEPLDLEEDYWRGAVCYEEYLPSGKVQEIAVTGDFPYGVIDGHIEGFQFEIRREQLAPYTTVHIINYSE